MERQSDRKLSSDPKSSLEEEPYLDGLQSCSKRDVQFLDVRVPSLQVVANGGPEPEFEIIAVPGLGAHPYLTWTKEVEAPPPNTKKERAHLLLLLKQAFPKARILCYVDNSAWLRKPIVKTPQEIGIRLQEQIKAKRLSSGLPVILIGHSLGGIIIKEALCADLSRRIIGDTVGIIFLGTPHQGARRVKAATLLAPVPKLFGLVEDTLIKCLTEHNPALSNLADSFDRLRSKVEEDNHKIRTIAFYETKSAAGSSKPLVSRDSAIVHADAFERWSVNTNHSNLNKCSGLQDSYFVNLTKAIARLLCPSRLQLADSMIRNQHYNADRLKITRLSGQSVDLRHCYINLAIEQREFDLESARLKKQNTAGSSFWPTMAHEELEGVDKSRELDLKTIFNQRKGRDGAMILPRRIMIRGRAGVGKSTLCKKMVHGFVHDSTWRELFHRILWIPLRHLARTDRMMNSGYTLGSLFKDEFFPEHHELAEELAWDWSSKSGKTLFVLDGLDELSQVLEGKQSGMKDFIQRLLEQPNLIVTSRCHVSHPAVDNVDLKAEVLGFHRDQVLAYLKADSKMCSRIDEFRSWLNERWILRDLVRTPILLDALCLVWDSPRRKTIRNTITGIYIAITQELRNKDIKKLELGYSAHLLDNEVKSKFQSVQTILEHLAFSGLPRNLEEFTTDDRNKLAGRLEPPNHLSLDETLGRVSFMRSSDGPEHTDREYHFIHRTFQEFFAAQYFVRHWVCSSNLEYALDAVEPNDERLPTAPAKFLERYKYTAQYDVFWQMVTGLIVAEHGSHLGRFFAALEQEPFDLLGPAHQRLTMHCLAEVEAKSELSIQSKLELRLSEWAQLEPAVRGLADSPEFPEQSLYTALFTASESSSFETIQRILHQLRKSHRQLSERVELLIFAVLRKVSRCMTSSLSDTATTCGCFAANVLKSRSSLSMTTARTMKALLEDTLESGVLRIETASILHHHPDLVKGMLEELKASLESEDQVLVISASMALGSLVDHSAEAEEEALLEGNVKAVSDCSCGGQTEKATISQTTQSFLLRIAKEDRNNEIRQLAATALSKASNLEDTILIALVEVIPGIFGSSRSQQFEEFFIGWMRQLSGREQDALVEMFQSAPHMRDEIADILSVQLTLSEKVLTTMRRVISNKSNDELYRLQAMHSLSTQMSQSWPTVVALTEVVTDDSQSQELRRVAVLTLRYQYPSSATTEDLQRLLEHPNVHIRVYALYVLFHREPELVAPARLLPLLQDICYRLPDLIFELWNNLEKLERSQDEEIVRIMSRSRLYEFLWPPRGDLTGLSDSPRGYAVAVLSRQLRLSKTVQNSLLQELLNPEQRLQIRRRAATVLGSQISVADAALLLQAFDKRAVYHEHQISSVMALSPDFLDIILNLMESHQDAAQQTKTVAPASGHVKFIAGLYEGLLIRGFLEQVTLCVYDNVCIIDQPQGRYRVPLDDLELDSLRNYIARRQQLASQGKQKLWCSYG